MSWVNTSDGIEIFYEIVGTGTPLIFQSGYMGIHDIWKYQVNYFRENYRCITHDNRGYGMSGKPESSSFYTMEKNADDLRDVMNAANVTEPAIIITHSMGGMIAMAFAEKYPERVKSIIMMGGPAYSGNIVKASGGHEQMWSAYQTTPSSSMQFYKNLGLCEEIAQEAAKWSHAAFTNQAKAVLNYYPHKDIQKILVQPVSVVHSKKDNITPEEMPQEIVDSLPNARMIFIDRGKHFPQTKVPNIINEIIQNICTELGLSK